MKKAQASKEIINSQNACNAKNKRTRCIRSVIVKPIPKEYNKEMYRRSMNFLQNQLTLKESRVDKELNDDDTEQT